MATGQESKIHCRSVDTAIAQKRKKKKKPTADWRGKEVILIDKIELAGAVELGLIPPPFLVVGSSSPVRYVPPAAEARASVGFSRLAT
jgi:hypothetical protein